MSEHDLELKGENTTTIEDSFKICNKFYGQLRALQERVIASTPDLSDQEFTSAVADLVSEKDKIEKSQDECHEFLRKAFDAREMIFEMRDGGKAAHFFFNAWGLKKSLAAFANCISASELDKAAGDFDKVSAKIMQARVTVRSSVTEYYKRVTDDISEIENSCKFKLAEGLNLISVSRQFLALVARKSSQGTITREELLRIAPLDFGQTESAHGPQVPTSGLKNYLSKMSEWIASSDTQKLLENASNPWVASFRRQQSRTGFFFGIVTATIEGVAKNKLVALGGLFGLSLWPIATGFIGDYSKYLPKIHGVEDWGDLAGLIFKLIVPPVVVYQVCTTLLGWYRRWRFDRRSAALNALVLDRSVRFGEAPEGSFVFFEQAYARQQENGPSAPRSRPDWNGEKGKQEKAVNSLASLPISAGKPVALLIGLAAGVMTLSVYRIFLPQPPVPAERYAKLFMATQGRELCLLAQGKIKSETDTMLLIGAAAAINGDKQVLRSFVTLAEYADTEENLKSLPDSGAKDCKTIDDLYRPQVTATSSSPLTVQTFELSSPSAAPPSVVVGGTDSSVSNSNNLTVTSTFLPAVSNFIIDGQQVEVPARVADGTRSIFLPFFQEPVGKFDYDRNSTIVKMKATVLNYYKDKNNEPQFLPHYVEGIRRSLEQCMKNASVEVDVLGFASETWDKTTYNDDEKDVLNLALAESRRLLVAGYLGMPNSKIQVTGYQAGVMKNPKFESFKAMQNALKTWYNAPPLNESKSAEDNRRYQAMQRSVVITYKEDQLKAECLPR